VRNIKIDSAECLEMFLQVLAEESVVQSKRSLAEKGREEREYQKSVASSIQSDVNRFNEEDVTVDVEEEESPPAETPEAEPQQEKKPESPSEDVSFYSIRDQINTIRSGESLRQDDIRQNLEQYVDALDDVERNVLHVFLKSIADIMTSELGGAEAQDTSDPPDSVQMSSGGGDQAPQGEKSPRPKKTAEPQRAPRRSASREEDITPPIQVGRQVTEVLRKKVRSLMS